MGFKTFMLENRLQMEMDKASIFHPPHTACLNEDGTLIPELSSSIGKLVEEVHDLYVVDNFDTFLAIAPEVFSLKIRPF